MLGWVYPRVGLGRKWFENNCLQWVALSHGSEIAELRKYFSCMGYTVTDARSRLSAEKVEAVGHIRWGLRAGLI